MIRTKKKKNQTKPKPASIPTQLWNNNTRMHLDIPFLADRLLVRHPQEIPTTVAPLPPRRTGSTGLPACSIGLGSWIGTEKRPDGTRSHQFRNTGSPAIPVRCRCRHNWVSRRSILRRARAAIANLGIDCFLRVMCKMRERTNGDGDVCVRRESKRPLYEIWCGCAVCSLETNPS